jgi:hypothetical protein
MYIAGLEPLPTVDCEEKYENGKCKNERKEFEGL